MQFCVRKNTPAGPVLMFSCSIPDLDDVHIGLRANVIAEDRAVVRITSIINEAFGDSAMSHAVPWRNLMDTDMVTYTLARDCIQVTRTFSTFVSRFCMPLSDSLAADCGLQQDAQTGQISITLSDNVFVCADATAGVCVPVSLYQC